MTKLDQPFTDTLKTLGEPFPRFKWYLSVIVCLAALNYPEEIPGFYTLLLEKKYIPEAQQFDETRKIREALTKICGIQGAAKVCMVEHTHLLTPLHLRNVRCCLPAG